MNTLPGKHNSFVIAPAHNAHNLALPPAPAALQAVHANGSALGAVQGPRFQ